MNLPFSVCKLRVSLPLGVTFAALLSACGDDASSDEHVDSGSEHADGGSSSQTSADAATPTDTEPTAELPDASSTSVDPSCPHVSAACADFEDPVEAGLAQLCARVAATEDEEQCQAIETQCLAYCAPNAEPLTPNVDGDAACDEMGDFCHEPDHGSGLENLCHETGHHENPVWCAAIYEECKAVCDGLGETDAGTDPHAEGDGGRSDASATDAGTDAGNAQTVTLEFKAVFGDEAFACGREYRNQGTPPTAVTPQDLRFYVSNLRLVNEQGEQVPFNVDEHSPFQGGGVALLDFEDGSGACSNGDPDLNSSITGTVPPGQYVGLAFSTSVPFDLNHADPTTLPAPLQAGSMSWGWLLGYKFFVAEVAQVLGSRDTDAGVNGAGIDAAAPAAGLGLLHLGSTECVNAFDVDGGANVDAPSSTQCGKPNRNEIELLDFEPDSSTIVVDVARLFALTDLTTMSMCHSAGDACPALFSSVGIDFESGEPLADQKLFHVE